MEQEITDIKTQKHNRQRVNIYLDGEFAFGLSQFVAAWLTPGKKLTKAEIDQLLQEDTYEVAFQKALRFITYRPRSVEETRRSLLKKGFSPAVVAATLAKLIEKDWLNDFEFARLWIENRNTFRPRSSRLLAYELKLKGVADNIINQALEDYAGDEITMAYKAGLKKAQHCQQDTRPDFTRKVGGFLSRRGFAYGVVRPTVDRLWVDVALHESERCDEID